MFNGQLKKQLEEQAAELLLLRQLRDQMISTTLSITLDAEFRMVTVNQKFANTLGYDAEQLKGRPMAEIVPAYVKNLPCFHNFRAAVSKLVPISDNYRFLRTDGSLVWLYIDWYPIRNAQGALLHMSGYAREVTKALQLAKENEAFIAALLRSTAVIQFNLDGTVVSANDQFLQGMGYSLKQILGKHHRMFCTAEEASSPQYKTFWQTLNRGEYVADRFKRIDSQGRDVWLEASYNRRQALQSGEVRQCRLRAGRS
jgi:methyl-accepting chemotaxis protein